MLKEFLNKLNNEKVKSQMNVVANYKKKHDCLLAALYHDDGIIVVDVTNGTRVVDIPMTTIRIQ